MTEKTEIQHTRPPELEILAEYAVGDVVKLKESLNPDKLWLLTTAVEAKPEGPMMGGIEIDQDGVGLGADGSILVANIAGRVGPRKPREEVLELSTTAFEDKYGKTLPREEVVAMLLRQMGDEQPEQ